MAHFSRKLVLDTFGPDVIDPDFTVRDADKPLKVTTTPEDCAGAVSCDPGKCAIARGFKRMGFAALIYRTAAYVAKSRKLVLKYSVDGNARAVILANDLVTEHRGVLRGLAGLTIVLRPPTGHARVGAGKGKAKGRKRSGRHVSKEVVQQRLATYELLRPYSRTEAFS